ncbi:Uma2 family endonuclease [Synechocystis sp. PCC 7509]|uniref:Uma2 family endonuclease n=1 Tax=Synechocystis sp. PCC 7509 TaxID=927677 RepID=UPI0002ABCFEC|nr:Uma2 family endonuclease [Synechocystis sp. PCC 7509]
MVHFPSKSPTLDDFLQLPETKPASEYIDNQIIQKPVPQGKNSAIRGELVSCINQTVKSQGIARAFLELRCTFGGRSTVPDVSVFVWDRIPRDENNEVANVFPLAPDWTIEILSPDQSQTKVTKNILHCLKYNTQLGWLIDPLEQSVFVYAPNQQLEVFENSEDKLPVPSFANELSLTVERLFAWLRE